MKKFRTSEKQPEVVGRREAEVKRSLLSTYLTSLLSMVLCVAMFFGTTYAWFTSEVNNTGNEIFIGVLEVELSKQSKDNSDDWSDLAGEEKLFNSDIWWEPGYTALETIKVANTGDLAFKYELNFTDGKLVTDGEPMENSDLPTLELDAVAELFEVWVYDWNEQKSQSAPTPTNYAAITAEGSNWTPVGTLADVLAGQAVLTGALEPAPNAETERADTYTIALHMDEGATAAVMGQKISLNVKLVAYQQTAENITLEAVSNAGALNTAMADGGDVLLISDVAINSEADRLTMNGGTLDGNGKTVSYEGERSSGGGSVGVLTTSGGTIRNLTIDGGDNGRALYITKLTSNLFVNNCTFSGAYAFNLNSAEKTNYTLNFTNTTFESWTSYANVMEHAYFTGCTFKAELRPYGDTTLTNCTFTAATLDVSKLEAGEKITLKDCYYKNTFIAEAVVEATVDGVGVDNALLKVDGGMLVLSGAEG